MKKSLKIMFLLLALTILVTGCGNEQASDNGGNEEVKEVAEDIPEISISWGAALHTAMLEVPINRPEEFKENGLYLNPLSDDKFELIKDDKSLAVLNFIPNKGASEVTTLMGQGHLDSAIFSNTGVLTAVDGGTDIKILCPTHTKGIGLVFPPETDLSSWEDLEELINTSEEPISIGYHSPVSAPRMIIESVLKDEGFDVTEDPNKVDADVLLVDLKGNTNLLPSLGAGQVDAWVGPSIFPETAEAENLGKIVMDLEEFPPQGKWANFPCCVFGVRGDVLDEHPEVFEALVELIDDSCDYAMENKSEAAEDMSKLLGVEPEIVESADINFTTEVTDEWLDGINIYIDLLNRTNKFEGELKGKSFEEVIDKVFDFSYIKD